MKIKVITYTLLPIYQLGNIISWIIAGLAVQKIVVVAIFSCVFLAFTGFYSASKIVEAVKEEEHN